VPLRSTGGGTVSEQESRTTVPIADPDTGSNELERVRQVLDSGRLSGGETVEAFGSEFAEYCETAHGIPTSNGTTALHAALVGLGIGEGDVVVTTPFSFIATANAVRHVGAEPVFADIDSETYNLDPDALAATIAAHDGDVDAIVVVHLYGCPADMGRIRDIAARYDVPVVEDAAQAHGAEYDGTPVGGLGDVGCFSFYPTKNITTGEGGAVVTDRDDVARRVAQFIDHGRGEDGAHETVGHNFRMSDVNAAIGRAQLEALDEYVAIRRATARRYNAALSASTVRAPVEPKGRLHSYHQYTVRCEDRERFRRHLADRGIDTAVYYSDPIHEEPAYDDVTVSAPAAERAADEVVSVPVHPTLSDTAVTRIETALAEYQP